MISIPLIHRSEIAARFYRWGFYAHIRLGLVWHHFAIRLFGGHRKSKYGSPVRYRSLSFAVWRTSKGIRRKPRVIGFEVYSR